MPTSVTRLPIDCTFGNFSELVATLFLPNFFGNFCKGKCVKIFHFYSEIMFGELLQKFGDFVLVTLMPT